jgi:hypothetical protein
LDKISLKDVLKRFSTVNIIDNENKRNNHIGVKEVKRTG